MAGEESVFRRCGCVDPVTGRQYGTRCPRLGAGGRHGSWYVRLELPGGLDGRRRRIRRGGLHVPKISSAQVGVAIGFRGSRMSWSLSEGLACCGMMRLCCCDWPIWL